MVTTGYSHQHHICSGDGGTGNSCQHHVCEALDCRLGERLATTDVMCVCVLIGAWENAWRLHMCVCVCV